MAPTLSFLTQAGLHAGCSVKHAGKAAVALWSCRPLRYVVLFCVLCIVLFLTAGCTSTSSWNPLNAWFGRKANAEAKTEAKASAVEDKSVTAAQVEVVKTGVALAAAAVEHPESRPVQVAQRTNANAAALLNQREALSVAAHDEAVATAQGLLSAETAKREAAEKAQAQTEARNRDMGEQLEKLRGQLKQLSKERAEEAAKNLALANELRAATIWKWAGTAGSVLLGLAAVAYRLNLGRFQTGAAEVLARLKQTHGDEVAGTARSVLDAVLHTGEQKAVFRAFTAISQK